MQTLTINEAARNFADVVRRASHCHETTTLLENGMPVARIVPATPPIRTGKQIAAGMPSDRARLGRPEAEALEAELLQARVDLPQQIPPWD